MEIKCPFSTSRTRQQYTISVLERGYSKAENPSQVLWSSSRSAGFDWATMVPPVYIKFTLHGHLLVLVDFEETFWKSMVTKLENFWTKFVAPLLLDSFCATSSASPQSSGAGTVCATSVDDDTVATGYLHH